MDGVRIAVEFENILASLRSLAPNQIADLVRHVVSETDGVAFEVLIAGLSPDAVRFLAARALLIHRPSGWIERTLPSA